MYLWNVGPGEEVIASGGLGGPYWVHCSPGRYCCQVHSFWSSVNEVPSGIVLVWRNAFPVVLLDDLSVGRAHHPFRRAESKYVLERL